MIGTQRGADWLVGQGPFLGRDVDSMVTLVGDYVLHIGTWPAIVIDTERELNGPSLS